MTTLRDWEVRRLLSEYWEAQAQFGPFEVGPAEYMADMRRVCRCGSPKGRHRYERMAHHSECTLEQFREAA